MRTLDTVSDNYSDKMFRNSDYFEAVKFSFKYESAVSVFKYAHGGFVDKHTIASENDWMVTMKKLMDLVPLAKDRNRLTVQVFNHVDKGNGDGLSGGHQSGFVFILDRKLIGWTTWMNFIS